MVIADSAELRKSREDLVASLVSSGALRSRPWRDAFASVPRHIFVPCFFDRTNNNGKFVRIDSESQDDRDAWLRAVYSDETLITQLDGENDAGAAGNTAAVPTSSSTAPGLMAVMLEALEISDGMNVLEIGTGTGYNAGLLCERLGSNHVSSTDIDPVLVDAARRRLRMLDYTPRLAAGNGLAGYPANAPYDRIVATVAVPAIPPTWIAQSAAKGRILANLYRELGSGALALLAVNGQLAEGHFVAQYGGFMPVRSCPVASALSLVRKARGTTGEERVTQVAGQVLDNPSFAFLAALLVPGQRLEVEPEARPREFWLVGRDGSWACQMMDRRGRLIVNQHGRHRLWDILEDTFNAWTSLGEPPRESFGLTITADGCHTLWHAHPGGIAWPLDTA